MATKIILYSYYLLVGLVPFLFYSGNFELFEFNKMLAVYILTIIIASAWLIKMIKQKQFIWQSTPLGLPLFLFLITQILSTIFSIDPHTSIFGYYSRLNGGLLSTIAYLILYFGFVSNFSQQIKPILTSLKVATISGVLISIWGIFEHFGHSLSCQILIGQFSDDCWVQDVQARVFASIGQPNWLAAYLGMLLFITIYFAILARTKLAQAFYIICGILIYLGFTFTYSRGAMLGVVAGLGIFAIGSIAIAKKQDTKHKLQTKVNYQLSIINSKFFVTCSLLLGAFLIVNLLFASALTNFKLIKQDAPPPRPGITAAASTQLENGGTESGQIRLIVWKGGIDIWRHYPVFGSGVETFAYSYYNFRPVAHNLVSEWDFLYNKAHNEFLNYLATTGAVGFLSYLLLIAVFIGWSIRKVLSKATAFEVKLLTLAVLGAYVSYLVQNFFQFSVVIIAVFFFVFPSLIFSLTELKKTDFWPLKKRELPKSLVQFSVKLTNKLVYSNSINAQLLIGLIIILASFMILTVRNLWVADTHYAAGKHYLENNNAGQAYNELIDAVQLNSYEPLYQADLGLAAANASLALQSEDATLAAQLRDRSLAATLSSLNTSPHNVSLWRTAYRSFFVLAAIDPKYQSQTLDAIDTTTLLAPTDPETYLNKGLVLNSFDQTTKAVDALKYAITLKPDYREAKLSLADLYIKLGQKDQAQEVLNNVLKQIPNDPEALAKLKSIK